MPGVLTAQKCVKKLKTFLALYVLAPCRDIVMWPYFEDEMHKSLGISIIKSPSAESTSSMCKQLPLYSSLVPNKFASDNLYQYMDIMADIRFYQLQDKMPLHTRQEGSKRLATIIEAEGLSALCFEFCFPHMYVGWRDILLKGDLCEQVSPLPTDKSNNVSLPQKQMAVLLNCFKCRLNLEVGKFAEAKRYYDLAEKDGTSFADSWITGVFYYTKVLVELQNSMLYKLYSNGYREESLGRVLETFKKCSQGFKKDAGLNFCIKYFGLAAEILLLCIEIDKLLHSIDALDEVGYPEQARSLKQVFTNKMNEAEILIAALESDFQYKSLYWHETLESMTECIEESKKLLDMVLASKGKLQDLRKHAMGYISVLIKHPNHEKAERPSGALFQGLKTTFQKRETISSEQCHVQAESNTERELTYNTNDSMSDLNDLSSENPDVTESNSE